MTEKLYLMISGFIFAAISLFHLLRIIFQWPAMVGTLSVPLISSGIVFVLAALLSFCALRLERTLAS